MPLPTSSHDTAHDRRRWSVATVVLALALAAALPHTATAAEMLPIADAGPSRYASVDAITLDGSGSSAAAGRTIVSWSWRQVAGPPVTLSNTRTPRPQVSGFSPTASVQRIGLELVVGDGWRTSAPHSTEIVIVPAFSVGRMELRNPPFRPDLPTLVTFGGGDCTVGGPMPFSDPPQWYEQVNVISGFYEPPYEDQGEWLIVYLSSVAPEYDCPIQTIGFSTGGNPAIIVANHLNSTYQDPRYAINRVTLIDAMCAIPFASEVARLQANPVGGEVAWVDTYRVGAPFLPGALNVVFPDGRHTTPATWFRRSISPDSWPPEGAFHGGLTAGAYVSVVGPGRDLRLATADTPYVFQCTGSGIACLVHRDPSTAAGRLPEPVRLVGPADGDEVGPSGVVLGCEPSANAVEYALILSPGAGDPGTVAAVAAEPLAVHLTELPHNPTYWTIRVTDAHGTTISAEPRQIHRGGPRPRRPTGRVAPRSAAWP
jgi:hypothetical protein